MLGKLIGAAIGAKTASNMRGGLGGPGGALLGAVAVPVIRRLGPLGMIVAAAGGYAFKRYNDQKQGRNGRPSARPARAD